MQQTNHEHRAGEFELTFWGGTALTYRRYHKTLQKATAEAHRVHAMMREPNAHPAVIYHGDKTYTVGL